MAPMAASATTASTRAAPCWRDTGGLLHIPKLDISRHALGDHRRAQPGRRRDGAVADAANRQVDQAHLRRLRSRSAGGVEIAEPDAVSRQRAENRLDLALAPAQRSA